MTTRGRGPRGGAAAGGVTPAQFKAARQALGYSAEGLARALRVQSGRTVRRWEKGDRDIPGPAVVALAFMLARAGRDPAAYGTALPPDADA